MNNSKKIKANIRKGDVVLSKNKKNIISIAISEVTDSKYSHAFFYIGNNKILESSNNGVAIRSLDHYLNDKYNVGLFRYTPEITKKEASTIVKKSKALLGIKYGYLQILWLLFLHIIGKSEDPTWGIDVSKGMICSEVIANVYNDIGKRFTKLNPSQVEPKDIDVSPSFIRIA